MIYYTYSIHVFVLVKTKLSTLMPEWHTARVTCATHYQLSALSTYVYVADVSIQFWSDNKIRWVILAPVGGKRRRGRRTKTWQGTLRDDLHATDVSWEEAKSVAGDHKQYRSLVAQCSSGNRRT